MNSALKNEILFSTNEAINSNTLFVFPCCDEAANATQQSYALSQTTGNLGFWTILSLEFH